MESREFCPGFCNNYIKFYWNKMITLWNSEMVRRCLSRLAKMGVDCSRGRGAGCFSSPHYRWIFGGVARLPGGVLDFGLDGGVPPGPRDPNPCLEVKKVPMFRDFAQKMDPCLGIFWKFSWLALRAQKSFVILTKNGPMFRDLGAKNGTHV